MEWADFVLRLLLNRRDRDTISGDLLEEYREVVRPSRGAFRARLWYVRQMVSFAHPIVIGVAVAVIQNVLNLVATAVAPLAEDTPGGDLLFVSPLLMTWFALGFIAARRSSRFGDAIKSTVLAAAATMIVFDLANFARVNMFLDAIQHRGDWQNLLARFHQSGFDSLRMYANYEYLRGAPLIVFIGTLVGAATGGAGAALGGAIRRASSASR